MSKRINVGIFYQTSPTLSIPGGIDTCIRGIIKHAPEDVRICLVGVSEKTSPLRPCTWHDLETDFGSFRYYPLLAVDGLNKQKKLPLSVQYTAKLFRCNDFSELDVLQFHRVEPMLRFYGNRKPKILIVHQNMEVVRNTASDIRWKYCPGAYFLMERLLIPNANAVFSVHEDAVTDYTKRFSTIKERFSFLPTWMDPEIFHPAEGDKSGLKGVVFGRYGFGRDDFILVFVGRIDRQKNPEMLVDAFALAMRSHPELCLLIIGDGILRRSVEQRIDALGLRDRIKLAGVLSAGDVALHMRASDGLALSSRYEGMPRCVVEALGCGVPVVTTNVGEVRKLVFSGVNGEVSADDSPEAFAESLRALIERRPVYDSAQCVRAVETFTPTIVLQTLYDTYRALSHRTVLRS